MYVHRLDYHVHRHMFTATLPWNSPKFQRMDDRMALYMQLPHEMDAYLLQITSRSPDIRWHSIPKFQQINRNHAWICDLWICFQRRGPGKGPGRPYIHTLQGPTFLDIFSDMFAIFLDLLGRTKSQMAHFFWAPGCFWRCFLKSDFLCLQHQTTDITPRCV